MAWLPRRQISELAPHLIPLDDGEHRGGITVINGAAIPPAEPTGKRPQQTQARDVRNPDGDERSSRGAYRDRQVLQSDDSLAEPGMQMVAVIQVHGNRV